MKQLNDEEAIKYLTTIKGVGKWTAEMFLFFNQLRPNIFPIQDIGLLEQYQYTIKQNIHQVLPTKLFQG